MTAKDTRLALEDLLGAVQLYLDYRDDMSWVEFEKRYGSHESLASVLANLRKTMARARQTLGVATYGGQSA